MSFVPKNANGAKEFFAMLRELIENQVFGDLHDWEATSTAPAVYTTEHIRHAVLANLDRMKEHWVPKWPSEAGGESWLNLDDLTPDQLDTVLQRIVASPGACFAKRCYERIPKKEADLDCYREGAEKMISDFLGTGGVLKGSKYDPTCDTPTTDLDPLWEPTRTDEDEPSPKRARSI